MNATTITKTEFEFGQSRCPYEDCAKSINPFMQDGAGMCPECKRVINGAEVKKPLSEQALELLKSSTLLPELIKEVQKDVVGETTTIMTAGVISAGGRNVINSQKTSFNLMPNEESGTGKDYVINKTLKVFAPTREITVARTRISPTTLTYWHNAKFEPHWNWDGKVLFLSDVSNPVLNSEVMKNFLSDGSVSTLTIKQRAMDVEINGKPVVIVTTAHGIPEQEMLRRFLILPLDSSQEQTKAIIEKQAKEAETGIVEELNETMIEAMKGLERVEVIIPFASKIVPYLPTNNIMRTQTSRFFDIIKASTALHQFQRRKNEKNQLEANDVDYNVAREILNNTIFSKNMIPITNNQKKILEIIKQMDMERFQDEKIHGDWIAKEIFQRIDFLNLNSTYENLNALVLAGFLQKTEKETIRSTTEIENPDGSNKREIKAIVGAFRLKEYEKFELPTWQQIQQEIKEKEGVIIPIS